jgi:hypothetical protein
MELITEFPPDAPNEPSTLFPAPPPPTVTVIDDPKFKVKELAAL